MTINSETRVAGPFDGNDSTVSFPFTFKVFDSDEVRVVAETGAVEADLELGTDYTVTLNADQNAAPGGSVVLAAPLPTGTRLTLTSALEMLQPVDLTNQGGFYPRVINSALDRLTILLQQLASVVSRTLKFPLSDGPVGDLPGRSARAGTVLAFDEATGEPVAGPDISSVNGVAGALVVINTVSDNIADVNTVSDNIADVNTVAGSIADVNTVADNIADVNTVADNIADVNTVADNITDLSNFSGVYYGPSAADPTTRRDGSPLQVGDLYFNTVTNALRTYNGSAWRQSVSGAVTVQNLSGDGVETEFLLDYAPDSEAVTDVFVNGVYQQKNTYSLGGVGGDLLIFNQAPPVGTDNIEVVVSSLTPSDDKLRQELASTGGAAIIGGGGQVAGSIQALRSLLKTSPSKSAFVTGYYTPGDGGGGPYFLDASDTTSIDNGGSVIVAADGGRWKLIADIPCSRQFGAKCDGVTDDTVAIQSLLNTLTGYSGDTVRINGGSYCASTLVVPFGADYCRILGDGMFAKPLVVGQLRTFNIRTSGAIFEDIAIDPRTPSEVGSNIFFDDRAAAGITTADFDLLLRRVSCNGSHGLVKVFGRGVTIDNCWLTACTNILIDVNWPSPFTPGSSDVQTAETGFRMFTIRDCRLHYSPAWLVSNRGANAANLHGVHIVGNSIDGPTRYVSGQVKDLVVSGNMQIHTGYDYLFLLDLGAENVEITGNTFACRDYGANQTRPQRVLQLGGTCNNIKFDSVVDGASEYFVLSDATVSNLHVDITGVSGMASLANGLIHVRTGSISGLTVTGVARENVQVVNRVAGLSVTNAKIDVRGTLTSVHNLAASLTNDSPRRAGVYPGNGGTQTFDVGFEPKIVTVFWSGGSQTAIVGSSATAPGVARTATGFTVSGAANTSATVYGYVAE